MLPGESNRGGKGPGLPRIWFNENRCVFNNQGLSQLFLMVSWDLSTFHVIKSLLFRKQHRRQGRWPLKDSVLEEGVAGRERQNVVWFVN